MPKRVLVISATSDIGSALCKSWSKMGWQVTGTYRTPSPVLDELQELYKIKMIPCDLSHSQSIEEAAHSLTGKWDILVMASGCMEPIGLFEKVDYNQWEKALQINTLGPLRLLHLLLPHRNPESTVLFFAGAGTNNPAPYYSAYALSKIALIKMCELLDAEISDCRFAIIGPGWVKTKIHEATLKAGREAGTTYEKTLSHLESSDWTDMNHILDCCNWIINSSSKTLSGRNYSVVFDQWNTKELELALEQNPDMYKLRRHNNSWES